MSSLNCQAPSESIAAVLDSIQSKGIRLWLENGQLHYRAPVGALTQDEIQTLRASKESIIRLLPASCAAEAADPMRGMGLRCYRAPLAFSQLAHWNLYGLSERPAIRQVASAMRLHGRLDIGAFRGSVAEVVRRHDALRTRIVVCEEGPLQEIADSCDYELIIDDLTQVREDRRDVEVLRQIDQLILNPIDVAFDPMWGLRLLAVSDTEHVLVIAMEHMISDAFSRGIFLRELLAAYAQAVEGERFSLPAVSVQFGDYAIWQRSAHKEWLGLHSAYWDKKIAGCDELTFPEDQLSDNRGFAGWGAVPVRIGRGVKTELSEWSRLTRTTLVMSIFTAFVALVLRWCNVSESLIRYQSDGRDSPSVENTIGYFASVLYLRIELHRDDSFVDLIRRVTEEYCRANEHADFSYMASKVPCPQFTRKVSFNWVPKESGIDSSMSRRSEGALDFSPVSFQHPMLKSMNLHREPGILLHDTEGDVVGEVLFPMSRFSLHAIKRFAETFVIFLERLRTRPECRVSDIPLL